MFRRITLTDDDLEIAKRACRARATGKSFHPGRNVKRLVQTNFAALKPF